MMDKTEIVAEELSTTPETLVEIKRICKKINMGLEDYLLTIKRGLTATKITVDKYGEEHVESDTDKQLKAAYMGLKVERYVDDKQSGAIGIKDGDREMVITWGNSSG